MNASVYHEDNSHIHRGFNNKQKTAQVSIHRIDKLYIYTIEYSTAVKKDKRLYTGTWTNFTGNVERVGTIGFQFMKLEQANLIYDGKVKIVVTFTS